MRRFSAIILGVALLLGCFVLIARAQTPAVTRVVTTFCGPGAFGEGAAQGFHWYTAAEAESTVVVDGVSYTGAAKKFQGAWAHSVVVGGLAPGREYRYRIGAYEGAFRTDPGPGAPVRFIVGGDTQATNRDGFRLAADIFASAFDANPDAGFYAILGDLTQNSDNGEWDLFFEEFESLNAKAPLMPLSGNHDMYPNWFRNMFTLPEQSSIFNFGGLYYSFDYGDAHIAVLNTNDWFFYVGKAQLNWLVNDMNASDARWKIVMTHRPVYTGSDPETAPDILALRRTLGPVCGELGVDLVLSGHRHSYYRSEPGDVFTDPEGPVYVIPGAAGGRGGSAPTFASIEIDGDTLRYGASIYDSAAGTSRPRDEFVIRKTLPAAPANQTRLQTDPVLTLPGQLLHFLGTFLGLFVGEYLFGGLLLKVILDQFS